MALKGAQDKDVQGVLVIRFGFLYMFPMHADGPLCPAPVMLS